MKIEKITLTDEFNEGFYDLTNELISKGFNPYFDFKNLAPIIVDLTTNLLAKNDANFLNLIKNYKDGNRTPAILILNGPQETKESLVGAPFYDLTYDYGNNPKARGKKGLTSELFQLAIGSLLGHQIYPDPHDHGGNKAFQIISPRNSKEDTSSSLSTNLFQWHIENQYGHSFSESEIDDFIKNCDFISTSKFLNDYNYTLQNLKNGLLRAVKQEISSLILSGVVNSYSPTSILTADVLKDYIILHLGEAALILLSQMNIAFFTGASQVDEPPTIGYMGKIFDLDGNHNIINMRMNMAENRMAYLGNDNYEKELFNKFIYLITNSKDLGENIILKPGMYIFLNNRLTAHKRDPIDPRDFKTPLEEQKLNEVRILVRSYWK
jgi:hypothetical protein